MTTSYIGGLFEWQAGATTKYYDGGAIRRTGYGSNNGIAYVLSDQLGSSTTMVSQAGAALSTNYYCPFGGNRGGAAFSDLTTKRFTGQYHESALPGGEGLSYYNARWYDPQLGRFASADTIVPRPGDPQAFNRYAYARNSPTVRIDPSGHGDCPVLSSPACKPPPDVIGPKPKPPKTPPQCGYFCNWPKWPIQKPPFIGPVKPPQPIIGKPPSLLPSAKTPAFVGPVNAPSQNTRSSTGGSQVTANAPTVTAPPGCSMVVSLPSCQYNSFGIGVLTGVLTITRDNDGNTTIGFGGSLSLIPISVSYNEGHIEDGTKPADFTGGFAANVSAGFIGGGGRTWSLETDSWTYIYPHPATETGIYTPQIGFSVTGAILRIRPDGSLEIFPGW